MADSSQGEAAGELVALVKEGDDGTRRAESSVKVVSICKNKCSLIALFNTGSPVSFVRYDVFLRLIQSHAKNLKHTNRKFVNIKGDPFNILGVVSVDIKLENLIDTFQIKLLF